MAQVFKKKRAKDPPSATIGVQLGRKSIEGDVGIEIEVEGKNLPKSEGVYSAPPPWKYKPDHSLRGAESGEYVLKSPVAFKNVDKALDTLWKDFKKAKTVFDESNRTSVHIHINCQQFHMNRLTSFMALYIIVEEMLSKWCGDHRVGNLFCLRAKDAPGIVRQIKWFIQTDGGSALNDHLHYSAMNANALFQYGSLEFRTLRGCPDPQTIKDWVKMLERLYNLSAEFEDPREICQQLSAYGPTEFFYFIFGNTLDILMKGLDMSPDEVESSIFEGMRLAQELCYCRDWTAFRSLIVKPDPFGRKTSLVAAKLKAASLEDGPVIDTVEVGIPLNFTPQMAAFTEGTTDLDTEMMMENEMEVPDWDD